MDWCLLLFCLVASIYPADSLKCYSCAGTETECQTSPEVTCPGSNDKCVASTMTINSFPCKNRMVFKGCVNNRSELTSSSISPSKVVRLAVSEETCNSNLCNGQMPKEDDPELNDLYCHSCISPGKECNSDNMVTMRCSGRQNHCLDINITGAFGDIADTNVKGCGEFMSQSNNLIFSSGKSTISGMLCNDNFCNIATDNDHDIDKSPNGVECYSCNTFDGKKCSPEEVAKVQCYGTLTKCLEVTGINFADRMVKPAVIKGCATPDVCEISLIPLLLKLGSAKVECCNGSLCNNKSTEDSLQASGYFPVERPSGTGIQQRCRPLAGISEYGIKRPSYNSIKNGKPWNSHGPTDSFVSSSTFNSNSNGIKGHSVSNYPSGAPATNNVQQNNFNYGSWNGNSNDGGLEPSSTSYGELSTYISGSINNPSQSTDVLQDTEVEDLYLDVEETDNSVDSYLVDNTIANNPTNAPSYELSVPTDSLNWDKQTTSVFNTSSASPGHTNSSGSSNTSTGDNTSHQGNTTASTSYVGGGMVPTNGSENNNASNQNNMQSVGDHYGHNQEYSHNATSSYTNQTSHGNGSGSGAVIGYGNNVGYDANNLQPVSNRTNGNYSNLIILLSNATGINSTLLSQKLNGSTLENPSTVISVLSTIPGFDQRKLTPELKEYLFGYSSNPANEYPNYGNTGVDQIPSGHNYGNSYGHYGSYGTYDDGGYNNGDNYMAPGESSNEPSNILLPGANGTHGNRSNLIQMLSNATGISPTLLSQTLNGSNVENTSNLISVLSTIPGFDQNKLTPELKTYLSGYNSNPPHTHPNQGNSSVGGVVYNSDQIPPGGYNHGDSYGHHGSYGTYGEGGHNNDNHLAPEGSHNDVSSANTNNLGSSYGNGSNILLTAPNGTQGNYSNLIAMLSNATGINSTLLSQKLNGSRLENSSSLISVLSTIPGFDPGKLTPELKAYLFGYNSNPGSEGGHNNGNTNMAPGGHSNQPSYNNTNNLGSSYGNSFGNSSNILLPGSNGTRGNYSDIINMLSNATGINSTLLSQKLNESTLSNPNTLVTALSSFPGFDPRKLTPELKAYIFGNSSQPPHTHPSQGNSSVDGVVYNSDQIPPGGYNHGDSYGHHGSYGTYGEDGHNNNNYLAPEGSHNESSSANANNLGSSYGNSSNILLTAPNGTQGNYSNLGSSYGNSFGNSSNILLPGSNGTRGNYSDIINMLSNATGINSTLLSQKLNESTLSNPNTLVTALSSFPGFDPRKLTPELKAYIFGNSSQPPHTHPSQGNSSVDGVVYNSDQIPPGGYNHGDSYGHYGNYGTYGEGGHNNNNHLAPEGSHNEPSYNNTNNLGSSYGNSFGNSSNIVPGSNGTRGNYSDIINMLSNATGINSTLLSQKLNESTLSNPNTLVTALFSIPGFDPRKLTPELKAYIFGNSSQPPHTHSGGAEFILNKLPSGWNISNAGNNSDLIVNFLANITGISPALLSQKLNGTNLANASDLAKTLSTFPEFQLNNLPPELQAYILGSNSNSDTNSNHNTSGVGGYAYNSDHKPPGPPGGYGYGNSFGHDSSYEHSNNNNYMVPGGSSDETSYAKANISDLINIVSNVTGISPAVLSQKLNGTNMANRTGLANALSSISGFNPNMLPPNLKAYIYGNTYSTDNSPNHNMGPGIGSENAWHNETYDENLLLPGRSNNDSTAGNSSGGGNSTSEQNSAYALGSKVGVLVIVFTTTLVLLI